jgi:hypothetical protein
MLLAGQSEFDSRQVKEIFPSQRQYHLWDLSNLHYHGYCGAFSLGRGKEVGGPS